MIHHLEYTRARLAQASERLRAALWPETRPLDELLVSDAVERISHEQAQGLRFRPAELGERFGPLWATYWFRSAATVPDEWAGRRVALLWDSASEATLWLDGVAAQGLNRYHPDATLQEEAVPGPLAFKIELACNGMFGRRDAAVELRRAELGVFDPAASRRYYDFETLRALEAAEGVDPSSPYALLPHAGGLARGWRPREAHRFNAPLHWTSVDSIESLAAVDDPNLVLDTVKHAEDSDAVVLRLYEAHRGRGSARLRVGRPFTSARFANGLEEDGEAPQLEDGAIVLPYRPHQLLTVKVS